MKRLVAILLAAVLLCVAGIAAFAEEQTAQEPVETTPTYEGEWVDLADGAFSLYLPVGGQSQEVSEELKATSIVNLIMFDNGSVLSVVGQPMPEVATGEEAVKTALETAGFADHEWIELSDDQRILIGTNADIQSVMGAWYSDIDKNIYAAVNVFPVLEEDSIEQAEAMLKSLTIKK